MFCSCIIRLLLGFFPIILLLHPTFWHSLAFFPLLFFLYTFLLSPFLSISSLFLSSPVLLTSLFLTYFLRLLQCSPPLCHENTHTYAEVLNHPPASPHKTAPPPSLPVPGNQETSNGTRTRCSPDWPIGWPSEILTCTNQGNEDFSFFFALKNYALISLSYCSHYSLLMALVR